MQRSISVIVPVLNEAPSLRPLCDELLAMFDEAGLDGEVIIVDDGSTDTTWESITQLAAAQSVVRGIRFQRNFGKAAALSAGVAASEHPFLATIDGDLQDDPREIPEMLAALDQGADLVSGWKVTRRDPWHRRWASWLFNTAVSTLTGVKLHDHNCGLKVARREVYDSISLQGGMHRFIPVLAGANGFRVIERPVKHRPRVHGRSKYGLGRLPRGIWDLLTVTCLTVHRERLQFVFGLAGAIGIGVGVVGLTWTAIAGVMLAAGWTEGAPLFQRPWTWLSMTSLLVGLQILVMSFLAELLVQRTRTSRESYLIAAETPELPRQESQRRIAN
jgi:Glycosyl transferase family 2